MARAPFGIEEECFGAFFDLISFPDGVEAGEETQDVLSGHLGGEILGLCGAFLRKVNEDGLAFEDDDLLLRGGYIHPYAHVALVGDLAGKVHGLAHETLIGVLSEAHGEVLVILVEILDILQALGIKSSRAKKDEYSENEPILPVRLHMMLPVPFLVFQLCLQGL